MGQKRMSSSLVKLVDDLQELKSANFAWKDFDEKIEGIGLKIKKKDFEALCINKDIYDKTFKNPGIIWRSISHNLLGWLENLKPIHKARLCTSAKIFYLKNK